MTIEEKQKIQQLKSEGFGYKAISSKLGISLGTVKTVCRKDTTTQVQKCKNCGADLVMVEGKKVKKFCSDNCRMAWWYQHQNMMNKKGSYEVECACCKKKFTFYGYKNRKYCSRECYLRDKYGEQ